MLVGPTLTLLVIVSPTSRGEQSRGHDDDEQVESDIHEAGLDSVATHPLTLLSLIVSDICWGGGLLGPRLACAAQYEHQ